MTSVRSTTRSPSTRQIALVVLALSGRRGAAQTAGGRMLVSPGAPEQLRAERRRTFFTDRLDPVLREARSLGIGQAELARHLAGGTATVQEDQW